MTFKFRSVRPDLPKPESWMPLVEEAYRNGWFSNFGPLSLRLEAKLAGSFGSDCTACIACASATAGLTACLIAAGISGRVLLPAFTFPASLSAIRAAGATPIVMDVDEAHWTVSPSNLEAALKRTRAAAVMLVAPFGLRQDFREQIEICRSNDIPVILDNAAGLGISREPVENLPGVYEVFSMHATKPFAVGEGGAIFANRVHEAPIRAALNFALQTYRRGEGPLWGVNGKMSEFHAAIALAQFERIGDIARARQNFAKSYIDRLTSGDLSFINAPDRAPWQVFPVLMPDKDIARRFIDEAAGLGVEIRRYYDPSLSCWPATEIAEPCHVSESLSERMCVLPIYSDATENEAQQLHDLIFLALDRTLSISRNIHT